MQAADISGRADCTDPRVVGKNKRTRSKSYFRIVRRRNFSDLCLTVFQDSFMFLSEIKIRMHQVFCFLFERSSGSVWLSRELWLKVETDKSIQVRGTTPAGTKAELAII